MKFLRNLRALFRKGKLDAEMAEEMRHPLEEQTRRNVQAGMAPTEAHYAAQRQFGNVASIQEQAREGRGWVWLELWWRDLRYAARALHKAPGFTFAVVTTLAVAIGLVTAVVNVAQPILLPEMPFPEPERLVILRERIPERRGSYEALTPLRFASYARHTTSFAALGSEQRDAMNVVVGNEPFAVWVSSVTGGFFAALGVGCEHGRLLLPEEYEPARAGDAVVLSHAAWTKFFGQDPSLVGRDIQVGERLRRVVGILPAGFGTNHLFPAPSGDGGIYLAAIEENVPGQYKGVNAVGRLKPGVAPGQAEAELATIHPEMPARTSDYFKKLQPWLLSAGDAFREFRAAPFQVFLGATGFLYLIGCTAVANLMLSRGVARRRELGVRLALGGSRRRIIALLLVEALLLALLSGAGGALVAGWAQGLMVHLTPPGVSGDKLLRHAVHGRTFALALGLGVLTCVGAALAPALRASRVSLNEALKEGAGSRGESRRLRWLRGAFVVTQGALAVALLTGAGLMLQSVHRLQHLDLGFVPEHKLAILGYRKGAVDRDRLEAINATIVARLASLPGVASAALTTTLPAVGSVSMTSVRAEGQAESENTACYSFNVTPDYFTTLEMPLLAGRGFEGIHQGDRSVAVIDEVSARQFFPNENPVGRFLISNKERLEIVGVVHPAAVGFRGQQARVSGKKGGAVTAQLYTPLWQGRIGSQLNAIVRLRQEPDPDLGAVLRRAVFEIDPSVVLTIQPLDEVVGNWSRRSGRRSGCCRCCPRSRSASPCSACFP